MRGRGADEGRRIRVDWPHCEGRGLCAEVLPEWIGLDEWGYPFVRPEPVPEALEDLAEEAVDACPLRALRLVRA